MGPQVLAGTYFSMGFPQGHSFLQASIDLLQHGVLHGMQVEICSIMDLHGLQGHGLPHHGLHHGLQTQF